MPKYQVIVGNIGTVEDTDLFREALIAYSEYRKQSLAGYGRAAGESVTLMNNRKVYYEYNPPQDRSDA